ncbi:MAG: GNAT family N-acetyltransferase [Sulfuricaulis sp.]|nr:GNAT family N-acetyltransferase [Sulfuricaulis sp.]
MLSPCDTTSEKSASLYAAEEPITPGQIQVECIAQFDELVALRPVWDSLLAQYPAATFFLGHVWACAWWQTFGAEYRLRVLVLRHRGKVIGIAPFMRSVTHVFGLPIRQISFFHNRHTLRGDTLFPADAEACLGAVLVYLRQLRDWDVLYLADVPAVSSLYTALPAAAAASGLPWDPWRPGRPHSSLPFSGTWQDYLKQRSSNFRHVLKKMQNRLDRLGHTHIECVAERQAMLAVLPEIFELERKSWHGMDQATALRDEDRVFQRRLVVAPSENQKSLFYLLRLEGRLVACQHLLEFDRVVYGFTTYHDKSIAQASPGTMLFLGMFRSLWEQSMREFDFNGDNPGYQRWTPQPKSHFSTRCYAATPYGRFLQISRRITRHALGLAKPRAA